MSYTRNIVEDTIVIVDENGKEIVCIRESADDESMCFALKGELLNEVAYELEDELVAGLSVRNHIVIDMAQLTYIASVGLRSLIKIQNMIDTKGSGEMTLCNLGDGIKQIFIQNGFLELFTIE